MDKMWAGRFLKALDKEADDFNSSIHFDCRMYRQDIRGSLAHAKMLEKCGILSAEDAALIQTGLNEILQELDEGALQFDMDAEDIHMFIEAELTKRIGDAGKRLHTARSRNDQVAVDIRMYLRDEAAEIRSLLLALIGAVLEKAEQYSGAIMPGYTHLQRAQPIYFGQQLLAYCMMFLRDLGRLEDAVKRMNFSPLGSCALAGTSYPIDRAYTASLLGFDGVTMNSIDGVSDRDFCAELLSVFSIVMMHLSRFSEEIILWSSFEFRFIELDDSFTTGSSIMPQKKNPDMAELVRGKTGRVYGDLTALLTALKGLPLAYNKDMQEDKEAVFDAVDTVKKCLKVFAPMIATMKALPANMKKAAQTGFINATDVADYLVGKGMPFRAAYKISGQLVAECIEKDTVLEALPLETYLSFSELFGPDVYGFINIEACAEKRNSAGGTGKESMKTQIEYVKNCLADEK